MCWFYLYKIVRSVVEQSAVKLEFFAKTINSRAVPDEVRV